MKRLLALALLPLLFSGCDFDDVPNFLPEEGVTDYRQEMRDFVRDISSYARGLDSNFIVIAHGGIELVSTNDRTSGSAETTYLNALDGLGQDSVFYGPTGIGIDQPTPSADRQRLRGFLDIALDNGNTAILVTDFAFSERNIDDSYQLNDDAGYISFAADHRELDNIPEYPPEINNLNRSDIEDIFDMRNFLRLTNTRIYSTRQDLVDAISETDYDLVIIDFFFDGEEYTSEQIRQLRRKNNGGTRLLIAVVNIGEAENNRFYWQNHWVTNPPDWLGDPIAGQPGDYRVSYWRQGWQDIIYGNNDSYLFKVVNAGFDGVYMNGVDAFDNFEE